MNEVMIKKSYKRPFTLHDNMHHPNPKSTYLKMPLNYLSYLLLLILGALLLTAPSLALRNLNQPDDKRPLSYHRRELAIRTPPEDHHSPGHPPAADAIPVSPFRRLFPPRTTPTIPPYRPPGPGHPPAADGTGH
ncbi:hypothetical protein POM88_026602 [Heracleum sosnowskyi]|uniref:Uncharacterized protein n=1 Tax=Heracleum sosnowskyi TaxID=360622 RepID=A0AAD8I8L3_9APIA|nr:hypothetical protein POM88_026602 [Heracleum sosnowskyi]